MEDHIFTVCLPDIGEGVVEGEVVEWLKQVGDELKQDEPVVIVMTDKATVELPAPYPGILFKQYFQVGEISIKDKPLYDIKLTSSKIRKASAHEGKEESTSEPPKKTKACKEPKRNDPQVPFIPTQTSSDFSQKALATPKVRALAKEIGIDIQTLLPTSLNGRILKEDLLAASFKRELPKGHSKTSLLHLEGDEETPLIGIRALMAKKMAEGHAEIPQFSYFEQVEATQLIKLRQKSKEKAALEGINLSYMPFFIRALSLTIQKFPIINSCVDMESAKITFHRQQNIGIAMASSHGLIVPVLKGVQEMSLESIIRAYALLKNKADATKLSPSDMKEATITITNFGVLDGAGIWATPMINTPEVAILGMARIRKEPVVRNNEVVIRDILPLSWSFDHRIIDGELAVSISHFYHTIIRDPALLV